MAGKLKRTSTKQPPTSQIKNKDLEGSGKQLYALVQWVGGEDDGLYSTDIPVEFIKRFDYEEFQKNLENSTDDDDFGYVVEWRDKKKQPKGGWKVYDCILKKVSSNKAVLERELRKYNGTQSFSKKFPSEEVVDDSEEQAHEQHEEIQRSAKTASASIVPQIVGALNVERNKNKNRLPTDPRDGSRDRQERAIDSDDTETDFSVGLNEKATNFIVDALNKLLKSDRERDRKIEGLTASISDLNGETDAIRKIQDGVTGPKYEIGVKGSGVFVTHSQWAHINTRQTIGSLAVALVRAVYPEEVLLRSNLKGGACKIKKSDGSNQNEQNVALDPKIMDAVYAHIEMKFPTDFKKALVGQVINQFLGKLRREFKGKAEKSIMRSPEDDDSEKE